ncbi:hypothetical protein OG738_23235 [Amycolatopsis sp. NBC_01488]|uniref:hypothetical protein n=1 Tax=Amycolatopsis sp. NBC_01488 TaxID=2903563 RepID=UPI002E28F87A|nr:hypothetical protein [Amycolatopsis sp. NBC_01488]
MTEKPAPRRVRAGDATGPASLAEGGAAARQRTCAACGGAFEPGRRTELEVLIDGEVRYVAVHAGHSTHAPVRARGSAA